MSTRSRGVSFNRNAAAGGGPAFDIPGLKHGPNGTVLVSSGIVDLDKILGGGFVLGSLVMVMEDAEAPHHMLLLRNFMAQGLVNNQQLLYASPSKQPRGFLGTLPSPSSSSRDDKSQSNEPEQDKNLRIAWQYKKYFGEQQNFDTHRDTKHEYCTEFDLRKPVERRFLSSQQIECFSLQELSDFYCLQDRCASFLGQFSRDSGGISFGGRIAIQSFCAPQCQHSNMEWAVLFFIQSLKSMIRSSNAVAFVTFPPTLSPSFCKRLQHMSDTLLSVKAIPDEDKELESLLTGYQDMVGLLNIHKVARFNTQVPVILEATTFSIKLRKRRYLTLECLNQAPVDGSSGSSYGNSGSCSGSSKMGSLDF